MGAIEVLHGRERDVFVRRVMGEFCSEIGADLGISKQRVSIIETNARAKVLAAANDNRKRAA